MYETLPYSIVVPALTLRNRPGAQNQATIDFGHGPLDLGNTFCIEFWFTPDYRQDLGRPSWPVVTTCLTTASGRRRRDLNLWLQNNRITPEFQDNYGPQSDAAPGQKWTHIALAYNKGQFRVDYWHEGRSFYE
ncbi:MAG: hypothetical protein ACREV8_01245, partial [Gammaproteobacteria bacterium]